MKPWREVFNRQDAEERQEILRWFFEPKSFWAFQFIACALSI
jgi:hypothetical protein